MKFKFVSWNVNGIRACVKKEFKESFNKLNADFFCIQESKMQEGQLDLEFEGYKSYWNYADKKGYSGTAIFTRKQPISVSYNLPQDIHNHEGRCITLEMEDFYLVGVYVPNAQDGLRRIEYRMQWEDDLRKYLKDLETKGLPKDVIYYNNDDNFKIGSEGQGTAKPVVYCGDLNVAHNEIDLKNPKTNRENPGFSDEERGKFNELLDSGFIDTWRYLNPEKVKYSWWSYRANARKNNSGWRIDYFVVSESLKEKIIDAEIHNDILGSDHCPVEVEIDF